MRSALVLLAACGRVGFADRAVVAADAAPTDALVDAAPPDIAPDAAILVDTITVPSDGTVKFSMSALEAGVHYTLVASGTFIAVPPASDPHADAEYYNFDTPTDIDTSNMLDFGLSIDVTTVGNPKGGSWGAYRPDHIYTQSYTGKGTKLKAVIFDCCYSDNMGSLTLQIFR